MKILLVDDDQNKIDQIVHFTGDVAPKSRVTVKSSFQSGLKEIVVNPPELLLLDMTMPNYDVTEREPGGRDRRYAGKEILRQMQRRDIVIPVIVVTQYEQFEENGRIYPLAELEATLRREFPECFLGAVFYQVGNTSWMKELERMLMEAGAS